MNQRSKIESDAIFSVGLEYGLAPSSVGAKAANLGKVMEHEFHVPSGYVVNRQALRLFLEQADLLKPVQEFIDCSPDRSLAECSQAHEKLCCQVHAVSIPGSLIDAVDPLAQKLLAGSPHGLAVRSSGIYEDSATASFAGVYRSFLGSRSLVDMWVAIRQCWCAAWAPAALQYARKMGITPEPDTMAVLVQQLIAPESAGVLFTADPQTGNPWRFVLESTFGLAEELVGAAGTVPVDKFVIEWDSSRIIERQIAEKSTTCVPGVSGVESVLLSDDLRVAPSLQDEMAIRIAKQALDIDRMFECRVDIEWAVADGEVYIVQVRPITALPTFFPHHLPSHLADRTWRPAWPYWYFNFIPGNGGNVVPPLYQGTPAVEKFDRHQLGPIKLQPDRFMGIEVEFNYHRFLAEDSRWSQAFVGNKSAEEREAYLQAYEPALRQAYLDAKRHTSPAMSAKVSNLLQGAHSAKEQIKALLWARDSVFDLGSLVGSGPAQTLFGMCIVLLRGFGSQYLPGYDTDRLLQGHHLDLDPYYPHVKILKAEKLAQYIGEGPIRNAFDSMDLQSLHVYLMKECEASPFFPAYEDYCDRFGLVPPSRSDELHLESWSEHYSVLPIVRDAMRGEGSGIEGMHEQATRRREACETEVRQMLAKMNPEVLERFEQLLDWALFWGPALNDRAWSSVPGNRVQGLWEAMCHALQKAGLVKESGDICYFTVEDLAYIAETGDVEEGRRIWERRRHEYERYDRLHAPAFLGTPPAESEPQESPSKQTAGSQPNPEPICTDIGVIIEGTRCVPGEGLGVARKIESLDEADTVTDQHVLLFTKTVQPTGVYISILLSLMLRIRGMIVQHGPSWLHHIGQIARECGVPIVQISPEDMACIPEGRKLALDGTKGTVTIIETE